MKNGLNIDLDQDANGYRKREFYLQLIKSVILNTAIGYIIASWNDPNVDPLFVGSFPMKLGIAKEMILSVYLSVFLACCSTIFVSIKSV